MGRDRQGADPVLNYQSRPPPIPRKRLTLRERLNETAETLAYVLVGAAALLALLGLLFAVIASNGLG